LRPPEVAQLGAAPLAARLLDTLAPGREGIGDAGAKVVVIVGHDGTLAMLGGLLGLDWVAPGYQPDQIAPGGALVFERWRRADGVRVIRARYVVQTLAQLRERRPLTLAAPPAASKIFIPGCSEATLAYDCPLSRFRRSIEPR